MNKPLINFSNDQFKELVLARCSDFDFLERDLLDGFLDTIEDVEELEQNHFDQVEELERTIANHEETIEELERTIASLS